MHRFARRLLWSLLAAFVLYVLVFSVATVAQLADAADRLHAGSGQWVFGGLLVLMALAVLVPSILLLRLPAALQPPEQDDAAAQAAYSAQLLAHLQRLPLLQASPPRTSEDIPAALAVLQARAEVEIRTQAASVLASTALLQNGRLDALVVLATQVRMVWRLARLYGLRPSLAQMGYLYGNVGACMLLASSLDDLDFAEMAAPLVQASTPAALASVPGLGTLGSLLTNSLASGAANAFLTLRVGLMAQAYCAPLQKPVRTTVRHSATVRAAAMLGQIVRDAGSQVSQAVYGRMKQAVSHSVQSTTESVRQAGSSVADAARAASHTTTAWIEQAGDTLQHTTLAAADATARTADAVQRSTAQATQRTRSWMHRAIVTLRRSRSSDEK